MVEDSVVVHPLAQVGENLLARAARRAGLRACLRRLSLADEAEDLIGKMARSRSDPSRTTGV